MHRNLLFSVTGLVLGLVLGFKAANLSYRRELGAVANAAAAQAASQAPKAARVDAGGTGQLTSEQSQQLMNQTRALIGAARSNPGDFDAQRKAAEQLMQLRQAESALPFLLNANRIKPEDAQVLADLGEAYFFAQKFDEAVNWSRRALRQRPDFPVAMFYLMASLIEADQNLGEAEQLLAKLEALRPGDPTLAQVRQHLQAAKQPATAGQGKSVLSHGPESSGGKP